MHRHGAQPHPGKHLASFDANFISLDMVGRHIPAWHQGFVERYGSACLLVFASLLPCDER